MADPLSAAVSVSSAVFSNVRAAIKSDLNHYYGLRDPVRMTFRSNDPRRPIGIGNADWQFFHLRSEKGGMEATLCFDAFPPRALAFNGPNLLRDFAGESEKDRRDGRMEMALAHDTIFFFAVELARQLGMSPDEVMQWGNGILAAAWPGYAHLLYPDKEAAARRKSKWAYRLTSWFTPLWRPFKRIFGVACAAAAMGCLGGCAGCAWTPPDWELVEGDPVVWYAEDELQEASGGGADETAPAGATEAAGTTEGAE